MRIREVMIVLLSLSIAGFGKNDEKEDELPPLPTWDPVDEELVQQGEIDDTNVQLIDIAPTALQLFGIDKPGYMEGQPLFEAASLKKGRS